MRSTYRAVALLLLVALLAGCGATTATDTASTQPTATTPPAATPSPTVTPIGFEPCGESFKGRDFVQIGDLFVTRVGMALDAPTEKLPDGTPLKPFHLATAADLSKYIPNSPPTNPIVDEHRAGGYGFSICNDSVAQAHVIQSVTVTISAFTAYTGKLNSWQPCDGFYTRQPAMLSTTSAGGCAADYFANEYLHATFAASATSGTSVVAQQTGAQDSQDGSQHVTSLPYALPPGLAIGVLVGLTVPMTPGAYTFAFSLGVDNGSPAAISAMPPALFAPVAHKWNGTACATPAMQSQLPPAGSQAMYWICPAS